MSNELSFETTIDRESVDFDTVFNVPDGASRVDATCSYIFWVRFQPIQASERGTLDRSIVWFLKRLISIYDVFFM